MCKLIENIDKKKIKRIFDGMCTNGSPCHRSTSFRRMVQADRVVVNYVDSEFTPQSM
jgi:hypothetical protein